MRYSTADDHAILQAAATLQASGKYTIGQDVETAIHLLTEIRRQREQATISAEAEKIHQRMIGLGLYIETVKPHHDGIPIPEWGEFTSYDQIRALNEAIAKALAARQSTGKYPK